MKSLLRLKPYLRPYLGLILTSGLLAIPLAGLRAGPALVVKYATATLKNPDIKGLLVFAACIIGFYAINFVVRFWHYYLLRIVIGRVNQKIKNDLFSHLQGLSADYFSRTSNGALISRVGQDPQHIDGGLSCINVVLREPLTFLFLLGYTFYLNWKLTLIIFAVFPVLAYVFSATGRNLKRYIGRIQDANGELFATLQETFAGIRVIQMFRLEKYVRKRFRGQSELFNKYYMKTAVLEEAAHPTVELLTAIMIAGVIYYGGRLIMNGSMKFEDLFSFFTAFALMMDPVRKLNEVSMKLHQASSACERVFAIFDWKSHILEKPDALPVKGLERGIQIENVRFAYPDAPEREVLKGVSFEVPKGKIIALVGASGAGKSSLISLLPRIFDVSGGRIAIDGQDLRDLALADLRDLIAVVSQDVFLFNDTVEENIRCGRWSATREELLEAARKAHAHEFIERLQDGYMTVIGDRGQKLSGGERQRLSIARAFLRRAPILVLDEATSSLDNTSERAVQSALDELMHNRTTLVIAHRLSTIRHADRIIVLKEGVIAEEGKHDDLIGRGGEYSRFHEAHGR
jgi:subfamily B ATP-binding cassette protein MsbA